MFWPKTEFEQCLEYAKSFIPIDVFGPKLSSNNVFNMQNLLYGLMFWHKSEFEQCLEYAKFALRIDVLA